MAAQNPRTKKPMNLVDTAAVAALSGILANGYLVDAALMSAGHDPYDRLNPIAIEDSFGAAAKLAYKAAEALVAEMQRREAAVGV